MLATRSGCTTTMRPIPRAIAWATKPNALHGEPEQPDGLTGEPGEEPDADRLRLGGQGGLLLQHEPEREEECSDEREGDVHAATLWRTCGALT